MRTVPDMRGVGDGASSRRAQKLLGYAYVAGQADDGEFRHVGTRRQRGIAKQKIEMVAC